MDQPTLVPADRKVQHENRSACIKVSFAFCLGAGCHVLSRKDPEAVYCWLTTLAASYPAVAIGFT